MKTLKLLDFEFKKTKINRGYHCDINDEYSFLLFNEKHYTELFLFRNNGSNIRDFKFVSSISVKEDNLQKWLDDNGEQIIKELNNFINEKIKYADTIYKLKSIIEKYSILL